jgi:peptide chain release factor 1
MYGQYAARQRCGQLILDRQAAPSGGYRHISLVLQGANTADRLRYEAGVHRIQVVPAGDPEGRIHTSTVRVDTLAIQDSAQGIPASPFLAQPRAALLATKIRTYNVPQDRLIDHRIGQTFTPLAQFLAGDLDLLLDTLADSGDLEAFG